MEIFKFLNFSLTKEKILLIHMSVITSWGNKNDEIFAYVAFTHFLSYLTVKWFWVHSRVREMKLETFFSFSFLLPLFLYHYHSSLLSMVSINSKNSVCVYIQKKKNSCIKVRWDCKTILWMVSINEINMRKIMQKK